MKRPVDMLALTWYTCRAMGKSSYQSTGIGPDRALNTGRPGDATHPLSVEATGG